MIDAVDKAPVPESDALSELEEQLARQRSVTKAEQGPWMINGLENRLCELHKRQTRILVLGNRSHAFDRVRRQIDQECHCWPRASAVSAAAASPEERPALQAQVAREAEGKDHDQDADRRRRANPAIPKAFPCLSCATTSAIGRSAIIRTSPIAVSQSSIARIAASISTWVTSQQERPGNDTRADCPPLIRQSLLVGLASVFVLGRRTPGGDAVSDVFAGLPRNHYGAILADPPWQFNCWANSDKAHGTANSHYSTMTTRQISRLPIEELAAKDCCLFIWICWPNLIESLGLMEIMGFHLQNMRLLLDQR